MDPKTEYLLNKVAQLTAEAADLYATIQALRQQIIELELTKEHGAPEAPQGS